MRGMIEIIKLVVHNYPISYYKNNEASYGMGWQDMERG